ncbi:hypothetical protein QQF64_015766 [Cirrhinus molitorella]|uniref:Uncharacterized protein n=1 Tax=Cirrhinus molitorella TaxID=172907 RepID=A0ABR3NX71_9TELE
MKRSDATPTGADDASAGILLMCVREQEEEEEGGASMQKPLIHKTRAKPARCALLHDVMSRCVKMRQDFSKQHRLMLCLSN